VKNGKRDEQVTGHGQPSKAAKENEAQVCSSLSHSPLWERARAQPPVHNLAAGPWSSLQHTARIIGDITNTSLLFKMENLLFW